MVRFTTDDDVRRLGDALAELRREKGLSQAEAGARIGMTSQGWGLYESGRRSGLFRPDIQRRLTGALDATPEALMLKLEPEADVSVSSPQRAPGVESTGAAFRGPALPADVRLMVLTTNEMAPWAAAGVTIAYRPGQPPREGQGCLVQMADGRRLVRLYGGRTDANVSLLSGVGDSESVSVDRIAALCAVVGRFDA